MTTAAIITLCVIVLAIVLFATEALPVDMVGITILVILVLTGVLTPQEGIEGFSNKATITVAFMFVLSAALLKTGALQVLAHRLSKLFKYQFNTAMLLMMLMIAIISAFVNNTPVVAMFIPVVIQIAHTSGQDPGKMLIPLSFASIFGGMCTLIGTSTNILVSGIAEENGIYGINLFTMTPIAGILLIIGLIYMSLIGVKLLPNNLFEKTLKKTIDFNQYITEIEILEQSLSVGQQIMNSELVTEFNMDIIEVKRNKDVFTLPQGDFVLLANDRVKVKCNADKIKSLKGKAKSFSVSSIKIGEDDLTGENAALVEMVITSSSEIQNKTLSELDFRRRYRAIPLAIKQRKGIFQEDLYNIRLRAGDVLLAEVKKHYVKTIKERETQQNAPFVLLSHDYITDFNKKKFAVVMTLITLMVLLAATGLVDILIGSITAVLLLVFSRVLEMKDVYRAINWKIIFLLAGALSLGHAIDKTDLDVEIANVIIGYLNPFGVVAIISGLYITTSLLTEVMSNNASAALMAPIAIATAATLGADPIPFLITIMLAASATFMTPIGYQTNTMVYSAGQYRFKDFFKVGVLLNLCFWITASFVIPWYFNLI
jgi:di/tricarboxylate transporter